MNRDQIAEVIADKVLGLPLASLSAVNPTIYAAVEGAADAIMALVGWQTIGRTPHKVMTREEYGALTILGPHVVDHSAEPGATHLWHLPTPPGDAG